METEDILHVQSRTIQKLHQYFEAESVPDEDYIDLVKVIVAAGTSILDETGQPESTTDTFQASLFAEAKSLWLATCLKNADSDENPKTVMKECNAVYDRVMRKRRR